MKWNIWQIATSHKPLPKWLKTTCSFKWTKLLSDECPRPLFFQNYINGLPFNLIPNTNLFAGDTSLFSKKHPIATKNRSIMVCVTLVPALTTGKWILILIWKKLDMKLYLAVKWPIINNPVHETWVQKHLGMFINFKLNFQEEFSRIFEELGLDFLQHRRC